MKVWLGVGICALLAGCNQTPQEKMQQAQEKRDDAVREVNEAERDAAREVNSEMRSIDNTAIKADEAVREKQQDVVAADENIARVQAEIAKDHADAMAKLNKRLLDMEGRVTTLRQRPMETDPVKQAEFATELGAAETELTAARAQVQGFASVDSNAWNVAYDAANAVLDRLDAAIDRAE